MLSKVNTLNTNLENANIEAVQRDVSNRLFGVLDWVDHISIDSELYASINNVTSATDIANYINTSKTRLPNTHVSIRYAWWNFDVPNSVVALTATDWIADTQNAITNMNNAIAWLNTLPGQINTLRNRLQENLNILNDAYNTQADFEAGWYTTRRRPNEIQNNINLCNELQGYLRTIDDAERYLSTHPWNAYYEGRRDNAVIDFNNNRCAGVDEYNNYGADFWRISGQVKDILRRYTQERDLSTELVRHENRFNKTQCTVPWDLWLLFNANHTVITTPLVSAADIDTDRWNIRNWLAQLGVLQWQIEDLRTRYQDNLNRLNRILALQNLQQRLNTTHPGEMDRRQQEFNTIRNISHNNLWLWEWAPGTYEPYLPNNTIGVWERWVWWNPARVVHLDFVHWALWTWFNGWARNFRYSLCDNNGTQLRNNWWRLEMQLEWWQTINIRWITFDDTTQTMNMNNIEINPMEWITFPLNLDLNVMVRIHDDDTWLDIDHHKPIHLEITRPTLNQAARENAYDNLLPPMDERIQAEYSDQYRENLENDAIWQIVRAWWNEAEINEIYNNETKREMFVNRVRNTLIWHFPFLALAGLQTGFRTDMTRENRDVPAQYLLDEAAFQNYLRQSIPENLKTFASREIHDNMDVYRNEIINEFLTMQADIANNRVDKADNLNVLANIPTERPEWHPKTFFQRLTWRESVQNNYTKFFQWRQAELKDLSLETEDWTINYWVKIEVAWINKLTATINIDWHDEPEIIDAPNHDELMAWILNMANTKDGEPINKKLLCNIALSVLKAMVLMSPQRLNRQIPTTNFVDSRWNSVSCDRVEAFIRWWNLILRWWWVDWSRTRHNVTIFDEAQFKELHDENMLENWLRELSTQINIIMNASAQEYDDATSAMRRNDINRYVMQYNTVQWLRGWPVKRLRWRMIHGKTSNDFDFDNIAINEAWKSVNISLNRWLFTVSWDFDWQPYTYRSRNLWSILRKKIGRDYVFNGVEFAMIAAINETFVQKLRKNHWVATENFIISDVNNGKTGRTYIFDSSWNLSYLEIEDVNLNPLGPGETWRIDPNQIPTARRRCNDEERKEFMQNPLLAWRLQREMRRRLSLF